MALIVCDECGKKISDKAKVCPNCGNPIEQIRLAEIDAQNREYYSEYNKQQLWINIGAFALAGFIGYQNMLGELEPWKLLVLGICVLFFIIMSISWVQWVAVLLVVSQKYKHVPKWMVIVTAVFGYSIGALIGLRS